MGRKHLLGILFLAILSAALILIFFWPSDERRIKKFFKEGASAVESEDLDGVMSKFSYNYRDDYGMTYFYVKEVLKREFEKLSDIKVEYGSLRIRILRAGTLTGNKETLASDRATVEAEVRVLATIGTETGYILGDPKSPLTLRFTLDKEQMRWRLVMVEGFRGGS